MFSDYVNGVQHIGIPTKDLAGTVAFYQRIGFERVGLFENQGSHCAFMNLENVLIETWEVEGDIANAGAINHIALDTEDVESSFEEAKKEKLNLIDQRIQSIPTFWKNGIRYFNFKGPNSEIIEICQID